MQKQQDDNKGNSASRRGTPHAGKSKQEARQPSLRGNS